VIIENFADGIFVEDSINTRIEGNTLNKNTNDNGSGVRTVFSDDTIIKNNIVRENRIGIWTGGDNNLITENVVEENQLYAILTEGSNDIVSKNIVSNNIVVTDSGYRAIFLRGHANGQVLENTVSNNSGPGIAVGTRDSIVKSNIVSGNVVGIKIFSENVQVIQNDIIQNQIGIEFINHRITGPHYHNNFINNVKQVSNTVQTQFFLDSETGGNFWSDFSPTCTNENNDNFCDDPYPFSAGSINVLDDFVWISESGWLESTQEPPPEPEPIAESVSEPECGKGTHEENGLCVPDERGGGCLIATATFGSELAPQVQQLREIRDNSLLQTQSGQSFMQGFNQFYYSFSPAIADLERENPIFKEMVKITITPLLTSLSILNYVDIDSEVEVLGYGISLIILNVGMYFVAPAIVVYRIKKYV